MLHFIIWRQESSVMNPYPGIQSISIMEQFCSFIVVISDASEIWYIFNNPLEKPTTTICYDDEIEIAVGRWPSLSSSIFLSGVILKRDA